MPASLRSETVRLRPGMLFAFPSESAFAFTGIRRRKFNRIIYDDLRPLRHAVAHSLLDDKEIAVPDDELMNRKLSKWLPLTKCIVRRVLKNEFPYEFLTSLRKPTCPSRRSAGCHRWFWTGLLACSREFALRVFVALSAAASARSSSCAVHRGFSPRASATEP
jgi:hypothetical protein